MQKSAHSRVDPKLAHVLGENYTSSEKALKELVDNAWDAEATEVHVTVPNILTDAPIILHDNGRLNDKHVGNLFGLENGDFLSVKLASESILPSNMQRPVQ